MSGRRLITVSDEIAELCREISYRERLYPRLVNDGRMPQHSADRRMETIHQTLRRLRNLQEGGDGKIET